MVRKMKKLPARRAKLPVESELERQERLAYEAHPQREQEYMPWVEEAVWPDDCLEGDPTSHPPTPSTRTP